jgi:hypothetical protein
MSREQIRQAYRAYATGDLEAGKMVDEDVNAVMKQTGASYSAALAARIKEFKQPTVEPRLRPTMAQRYAAGKELDQVATALMRWKGIEYSQALREGMLANPILAENYGGHPVRQDGFRVVYGVATPMQKLGNIIQGVPKQDDGSLDVDTVLGVLELFSDLNREAAEHGLTAMARKAVDNLSGQITEHLPRAMDEVRRRYPALRRMAETGEATTDALRTLFPQFFK